MGRKRKEASLQPTPAELEILQVLWGRGGATVRVVHEALLPSWPVGYTTVLKMMQVMAEKGLVERDTDQRSHVYRAAITKTATQRRLVRELLDRAFDGSLQQLLVRAIEERSTSAKEIEAIRRLLEEHKRGTP